MITSSTRYHPPDPALSLLAIVEPISRVQHPQPHPAIDAIDLYEPDQQAKGRAISYLFHHPASTIVHPHELGVSASAIFLGRFTTSPFNHVVKSPPPSRPPRPRCSAFSDSHRVTVRPNPRIPQFAQCNLSPEHRFEHRFAGWTLECGLNPQAPRH